VFVAMLSPKKRTKAVVREFQLMSKVEEVFHMCLEGGISTLKALKCGESTMRGEKNPPKIHKSTRE